MALLLRLKAFAQRHRRGLIAAGSLLGLYSAFGFFIAPGILKSKLVTALQEATHRPVAIGKVRVNPLVPSVTVEGLEIRAKSGAPWIACERIYVNARVLPLLWHTVALKELAILHPSVQVALDAKGQPEFADLFEDGPDAAPAPSPSKPWTFALGHFSLTEGQVPFLDQSTQPDFRSVLGPLSITLDDFRTTPGAGGEYAFAARTNAGEVLAWSGTVAMSPFSSNGRLSLKNLDLVKYGPYLRELLDMELRGGRADLEAHYQFLWGPSAKRVTVDEAKLSVTALQATRPGVSAPDLIFPTLQASGIRADLLANRVEVGLLTGKDGAATLARAKDGTVNLAQLFGPPAGVTPKPKNPAAKALTFTLDEVALQNFRLDWADDLPARPVRLSLSALDLTLRDFTLDPKHAAQMAFQARIGETGLLHLSGPIHLLGLTGDLTAEGQGLDLQTFDPYFEPALDLRINQGQLGLKGRLKVAFEGTNHDGIAYLGDAWVDGFEAADGRDHEVMLRWKRLQLSGLDTTTAPMSLKLRALAWTAPEGRLVIAGDGTSNVARALKLADQAPASAPAAMVTPTPPTTTPMTLAITLVTMKDGRLSFMDRNLQPNASLLLDNLQGRYEKLSTDPAAISTVDFTGLAGGLAPLSIKGRAMPFRTDQDTDVTVKVDGSELADFDPYVRRYIGRSVQKGKLGLDAHVVIQHRGLNVLAKVKLDQFYLGDKVDSPEATHLPVKLALALLRDRRGVIAFELPVQGNLDDPDIKYGRVVWSAVLNVLGKVAASPFTLLGSLFGGGEDLSSLAFAPGQDQMAPESQKKLQALAKALAERPDLQLEVEGAADPVADGAALRRAALDALLKTSDLKTLFLKSFPPDPKSKAPEPPPAEMEQRLLTAQKVEAGALDALAERRVKAVLSALQMLQAPSDRIFQAKGTRSAEESHQPRVWFALE